MPTLLHRALIVSVLVVLAAPGAYAAKAARPQGSLPVDPEHMVVLVKTTLIAVNHANRTGDYSVLRALAAPAFRDKNSEKDLAKIFAGLRQANLDMGPIVLFAPRYTQPPGIMPGGHLRLTGHFPTRPVQVNFDLVFQAVGGQWQLNGVSLQPTRAMAAGTR